MSGKSQCERIKAHLKRHGSITPMQALRLYGSFRLGARIYNLKKQGCKIKSHLIKRGGKRFAEYSLSTQETT